MMNNQVNMTGMMRECMRGCRWCAFMPIVFGAALFLLGYYLDAEVVRTLWLILTGFMILMGAMMFLIASLLIR